jgi:hypothetical protein
VEILTAAGAALLAAYWFSVWRRPYRKCQRCNGSKANADTNKWKGAFGRCWRCGGSGQRIRWGVRVLTPGAYRNIKAGQKGKNF